MIIYDKIKNRLDGAAHAVSQAKYDAQRALSVYVATRILEKTEEKGIVRRDLEEWLAGRDLGIAFTQYEQTQIFGQAREFFSSPNNLGANVVRELGMEDRLILEYCVVGERPDLQVAQGKYIFLRPA